MAKLEIIHDLSTLRDPNNIENLDWGKIKAYLAAVSEYIGLDPLLNGLDTIWMPNENGPGKSLVVYARRGTAEILRNKLGIEVDELTEKAVGGSIVFTVKGHNASGRHEIAVGSKFIEGLTGKQLDDAIMTASTRALRRLTMQFTTLGILDESEVASMVGQEISTAGSAQLAPVIAQPTVAPNNAPGKDTTPEKEPVPTKDEQFLGQPEKVAEAWKQVDKKAATKAAEVEPTPAAAPVTPDNEADKKAAKKTPKRKKNTVSLDDVEAETVQASKPTPAPEPVPQAAPETVKEVVPAPPSFPEAPQAVSTPVTPPPVAEGMPTKEQMDEYRKKVSAYTAALPSSPNLGSVQKMRAFITHMNDGTSPQMMTVEQWQDQIAWFEAFVEKNQMKGLVKYINDTLGVK